VARGIKKTAVPAMPTTIHEAELATDGSGAVYKGNRIDEPTAVAKRKASLDVVVCGSDLATNRTQAREIERQVSPAFVFHNAHPSSGPDALPHFQPAKRPPAGHTFYEGSTRRFKARNQP
jgi:hypothetical protein